MRLATLSALARHWGQARSRYRVHSPYVFRWHGAVLRGDRPAAATPIEALRRQLRSQGGLVTVADLGAGPGGQGSGSRQVPLRRIARRAACSPRKGALLHRLVRFAQPQRVLELGTNLGISTAYLASALPPGSQLHSIEGAPALAQLARQHLHDLALPATVHTGDFTQVLEAELPPAQYQPDWVYLDGNHRYAPTCAYLDLLIPHMPPGSVLVLDDIRWSAEMARAWDDLCTRPEVSVSIDLFWIGIVILRRPQAREHFRFRWWP